jgi:hypothetical protein
MFTIDLLKGAGKPPESRPLSVAGIALAFMALIIVAAIEDVRYFRASEVLATQKRTLAYYSSEIQKLKNVAEALDAVEKRRIEVNGAMAEVNKALSYHATWSPVIAAMALNTPPDLVLTDIMAKREEQGSGEKVRFTYTLMLGVMSPSGAAVVEQYVRTLRLALTLQPGPDSIRIISQRQDMIAGQPVQYYVVECRLKM